MGAGHQQVVKSLVVLQHLPDGAYNGLQLVVRYQNSEIGGLIHSGTFRYNAL